MLARAETPRPPIPALPVSAVVMRTESAATGCAARNRHRKPGRERRAARASKSCSPPPTPARPGRSPGGLVVRPRGSVWWKKPTAHGTSAVSTIRAAAASSETPKSPAMTGTACAQSRGERAPRETTVPASEAGGDRIVGALEPAGRDAAVEVIRARAEIAGAARRRVKQRVGDLVSEAEVHAPRRGVACVEDDARPRRQWNVHGVPEAVLRRREGRRCPAPSRTGPAKTAEGSSPGTRCWVAASRSCARVRASS